MIDIDVLDDLVFKWPAYSASQREDLRAALAELRASRKVVEAAELLEGTGPRPILLAALTEWETLK